MDVIGFSSTLRSKLATPKSMSSDLTASRPACVDIQSQSLPKQDPVRALAVNMLVRMDVKGVPAGQLCVAVLSWLVATSVTACNAGIASRTTCTAQKHSDPHLLHSNKHCEKDKEHYG